MPFAAFAALDDAVERNAEGAFALLEDLVAADSTVGREQAALEVLAGELHRLGLQVDRLPFPSGPLEDPRAGVSQAVFARCLNVTATYISQIERGEKHPRGATLKLLSLIQKKGLDAVL